MPKNHLSKLECDKTMILANSLTNQGSIDALTQSFGFDLIIFKAAFLLTFLKYSSPI